MRLAYVNPELDDGPCGRLTATTARLRIRPGETPVWVDAEPAARFFAKWRADADAIGMPLDGLVAARIELLCAIAELGVTAAKLRAARVRVAAAPARLAPPILRPWVAVLSGSRDQPQLDELPEVVVPARLSAGLPSGWWRRCSEVSADAAHAWELMSAAHGCTLKELVWASCRPQRA